MPRFAPSVPSAAEWEVQAKEYERQNPDYAQLIMQQKMQEDTNKLFKELKRKERVFVNEERKDML
jgi:hypothetical protein